jgi:hypothetical protein
MSSNYIIAELIKKPSSEGFLVTASIKQGLSLRLEQSFKSKQTQEKGNSDREKEGCRLRLGLTSRENEIHPHCNAHYHTKKAGNFRNLISEAAGSIKHN